MIEAGFAEVPVIATSVGGIPEVIENEKTGLLIRPKNPKEIANAIRVLYENKDLPAQAGNVALLYAKNLNVFVQNNFSLEKMIAETEKILAD